MNTNFKYLTLLALAMLTFGSCRDRDEKEGGELIEQNATFYSVEQGVNTRANFYKVNATELEEAEMNEVTKTFKVDFAKPLTQDSKLSFSLSDKGVTEYNKVNGTNYPMLPKELITLPENVIIKSGEIASPELKLSVQITDAIKLNQPYIFVLELGDMSASGIRLFHDNKRIVYTLIRNEESTELKKSLQMTRKFFLRSDKLSEVLTKEYGNSSFTLETLINVQKFRSAADPGEAQISTLFGVEGKTLFRFGDAGIPGNMLQAAGRKIDFVFGTNKWYHIAISYNKDTKDMLIYINGKEAEKQTGVNASLRADLNDPNNNRGWFIGHSWSDNRGIKARFAETRIWKVVRSAGQIADSMYGVNPKDANLIAYWQMNKVKDNVYIPDVTGNGFDMKLAAQASNAPTTLTITNEAEPISVD